MFRSALVTLAGCVLALFAVTAVVGWVVDGERSFAIHFALGLCTVVFTLLTHCLVMTYLIISGKMVRIAVDRSRLDRDYIVQTKELKAQTFPFMVAAIVLLLATAFFGAGATNRSAMAPFHWIAALTAMLYNGYSFLVSYRTVSQSMALGDRVFAEDHAAGVERSHTAHMKPNEMTPAQ